MSQVRFERCHASQWRLGLRPEKCTSGAGPHDGRFGSGDSEAGEPSVGRPGLADARGETAPQRRERLRRIFRAHAAGCPHRATGRHGTAAHPFNERHHGSRSALPQHGDGESRRTAALGAWRRPARRICTMGRPSASNRQSCGMAVRPRTRGDCSRR
jgi:hypothetical protein